MACLLPFGLLFSLNFHLSHQGHHELLDDLLPSSNGGGQPSAQHTILIHTGDFANKGNINDARNFIKWLKSSPKIRQGQYSEILVIDGNHDRDLRNPNAMKLVDLFNDSDDTEASTMQQPAAWKRKDRPLLQSSQQPLSPKIHFLQDELVITKCGLRVFGASWKTCESDTFWNSFENIVEPITANSKHNTNVDVVLAHKNPKIPKGILFAQGLQPESSYKGWRGSKELSSLVLNFSVPLCLTGHVHWSRGYVNVNNNKIIGDNNHVEDTTNSSNNSIFINSASLWPGKRGVGVSSPVIIDYDLRQRKVIQLHCEPHPS